MGKITRQIPSLLMYDTLENFMLNHWYKSQQATVRQTVTRASNREALSLVSPTGDSQRAVNG